MKFKVNSRELFTKLQNAGRVISNKNMLPILDCFMLGLDGSELKIAASDQEIRVSTKVDVTDSTENGIVCIDAKTILDALKELPDQPLDISINTENYEVVIEYHNGRYTFIGQDASNYPQPNKLTEKERNEINISAETLLTALHGTAFAAGNDELRPVMTSIYFDVSRENITFVASDGHKLVKLNNNTVRCDNDCHFILPIKAANLLKVLLAKQTDTVKIIFDLNRAIISISDYTISVRFEEGRYPNYNAVIPTNNPYSFEVSRDVLLATVKRISTLGNKATNLVKFDLSESKLIVSSQDIDFSTAAEENINIDYSGVPMCIGFKSVFLIEILNSIMCESVIFTLSDPTRAAIIKPIESEEGWDNLALLMPMMLNE